MVHMRIVTPADRTGRVTDVLFGEDAVCNVIVLPGAAKRPDGDLVLCDVAREDASVVVSDLRDLGIEEHGSIALEVTESVISRRARTAVLRAAGDEADAVIWEEVETKTQESATFSESFALFMALAACIAAAGIFLDSEILIVGAMVVGPEFGPLAGVCVALVQRRRGLALRSILALALGFPIAIAAAFLLAGALLLANVQRADLDSGIAGLIASPDVFTVIVAFCAGVAGMVSLSTAKSGAIIGVLISVTTIPAAAEIGVAAAEGEWSALGGAAAQLAINLVVILVAGTLTLSIQRAAFVRRRRVHLDHRAARRAADTPGSADEDANASVEAPATASADVSADASASASAVPRP